MLKKTEDDLSLCKSSALRLYLPEGLVLRLMAEVCLLLSCYLLFLLNENIGEVSLSRMLSSRISSLVLCANLRLYSDEGLLVLGAGYGLKQTLCINIRH
jgi:hypothetical protein